MINNVTVTNHRGESIVLELRSPEKSGFFVRSIDGLDPSKAEITATDILSQDGAIFNSARLAKRNIVFNLGFLEKPTIEDTRLKSYKYFPVKKRIKITVETDTRICETYGYVESNETDIFSEQQGAIISVICMDSYLYSVTRTVTLFSGVTPQFEFPFSNDSLNSKLLNFGDIVSDTTKSVVYTGDASTGIIMYIHAVGAVNNLTITNATLYETMILNSAWLVALTGSDIIAGDDIIISSIRGNKFIYLIREGVTYNILNCLGTNIDWFQLEQGDNLFVYTADSGISNLLIRVENPILYDGV